LSVIYSVSLVSEYQCFHGHSPQCYMIVPGAVQNVNTKFMDNLQWREIWCAIEDKNWWKSLSEFSLCLCFGVACSGVARICCEEGRRWKLCHGALTVNFGCSNCSMT